LGNGAREAAEAGASRSGLVSVRCRSQLADAWEVGCIRFWHITDLCSSGRRSAMCRTSQRQHTSTSVRNRHYLTTRAFSGERQESHPEPTLKDTSSNHPGASGLWGTRLSNTRGIRCSCGGDVTIERCRRDAEAVRDSGYADVGIGQHGLVGLDVVVGKFRRTATVAANAPCGGKACLGALPDQAALEFRRRTKHCEKQADPARSSCRGLRSGCESRYLSAAVPRWFRSITSLSTPKP
jgi:hypothetical protein